jgi:hypothetical protein
VNLGDEEKNFGGTANGIKKKEDISKINQLPENRINDSWFHQVSELKEPVSYF